MQSYCILDAGRLKHRASEPSTHLPDFPIRDNATSALIRSAEPNPRFAHRLVLFPLGTLTCSYRELRKIDSRVRGEENLVLFAFRRLSHRNWRRLERGEQRRSSGGQLRDEVVDESPSSKDIAVLQIPAGRNEENCRHLAWTDELIELTVWSHGERTLLPVLLGQSNRRRALPVAEHCPAFPPQGDVALRHRSFPLGSRRQAPMRL